MLRKIVEENDNRFCFGNMLSFCYCTSLHLANIYQELVGIGRNCIYSVIVLWFTVFIL